MVWVLNGPNLGRLGRRQPEIYGLMSHDELVDHVQHTADRLGLDVVVRQTDFGIKPFSLMMGTLQVADEVTVVARATV